MSSVSPDFNELSCTKDSENLENPGHGTKNVLLAGARLHSFSV